MTKAAWMCGVGVLGLIGCGGAPGTAVGEGGTPMAGQGGAPPAAQPSAPARPVAPAEPAAPATVAIPAGTALAVELGRALSTDTAAAGDAVTGTVTKAVSANGRVVVPAGAVVTGTVAEADRAGRVKGVSRLVLSFTSVTVAGTRYTIAAEPVVREGEETKGEDATKVGIGAGAGAVVGAILGGKGGAAKGAAVGAAGGTGVVLATRGRALELAKGAALTVRLSAPVTMKVRAGA